MSKLLNQLMFLPLQILWKMLLGVIKLPTSKPIEILMVLIILVIVYVSMPTEEYKTGLIVGSLLGFYLLIKGRKQK